MDLKELQVIGKEIYDNRELKLNGLRDKFEDVTYNGKLDFSEITPLDLINWCNAFDITTDYDVSLIIGLIEDWQENEAVFVGNLMYIQ